MTLLKLTLVLIVSFTDLLITFGVAMLVFNFLCNYIIINSFVTGDKKLQPEISSVDCTERNVVVKWINHHQDAYSEIWDHCVYYNCSTSGGDVTGEMVS